MPPPTPTYYTHTTRAQAVTMLSLRLSDPLFAYWTSLELQIRLNQSLRMWQAFTGFYHNRYQFNTTRTVGFYDLSLLTPSTFGYFITDTDLVTGLQFSLLEPPTGTSWTGSAQFTYDQVTKALQ